MRNDAAVDAEGYSHYRFSNSSYYYGSSPAKAPEFALFASCWTTLFALYLFLTSATSYTRTDRPIGRFFNQRIVLAVDCLCVVFWFAGFISLAQFSGSCGDPGSCGTVITSIFIALCLWYDCCSTLTLKDE